MQTVIGLFKSAFEAQRAAQQLLSSGFTNDDIDVSVRNDSDTNNFSQGNYSSEENPSGVMGNNVIGTSGIGTSGMGISGMSDSSASDSSIGARDYRTGDVTGDGDSAIGGSGMTLGNYERTDQYTNSDDYAGNRESRHTSEGESFGDKISHFFKNLFGNDDDEAGRYSHVASKTGNMVTVHAQTVAEAERARDILDENGALDINDSATQYGYVNQKKNFSSDVNEDEGNTLKVIREDVEVGKREVETGGVKLRSRIVERPVEEKLRLREERVKVERTPVDRPATEADFQTFKEGEVEMTERAEVADVSKTARVVEEVKLSKEVNERDQTIHETARNTEVDVEDISGKDVTGKSKKSDY